MANVYYEADANRELLANRKVAVIGYGIHSFPTRRSSDLNRKSVV